MAIWYSRYNSKIIIVLTSCINKQGNRSISSLANHAVYLLWLIVRVMLDMNNAVIVQTKHASVKSNCVYTQQNGLKKDHDNANCYNYEKTFKCEDV